VASRVPSIMEKSRLEKRVMDRLRRLGRSPILTAGSPPGDAYLPLKPAETR
jgi:hypothetical protein